MAPTVGPHREPEPIDLIRQAQDAVAQRLRDARGDDHTRLLRAGLALLQAGQALEPTYAKATQTRRRRTT